MIRMASPRNSRSPKPPGPEVLPSSRQPVISTADDRTSFLTSTRLCGVSWQVVSSDGSEANALDSFLSDILFV